MRGGVGGRFEEEFLALGDAEAVLLVDDAEGEGVELGVVGEQGVGADDEVEVAGGDLGFEGGFVLGGAGEEGEARGTESGLG